MENSRSKQLIRFKFRAVLNIVMKSQLVLLRPTQAVNHPSSWLLEVLQPQGRSACVQVRHILLNNELKCRSSDASISDCQKEAISAFFK